MSVLRGGYRGYIASRPVRGERTPQQVQNLVIRDYAARNGLMFKLSATEYAMAGCTMMLNAVADELPKLDGVILFSLFMLPDDRDKRHRFYQRILDHGCSLHAALENVSLDDAAGIARFEDILHVDAFAAKTTPRSGVSESWLT